jgi:hypothetical protein
MYEKLDADKVKTVSHETENAATFFTAHSGRRLKKAGLFPSYGFRKQ